MKDDGTVRQTVIGKFDVSIGYVLQSKPKIVLAPFSQRDTDAKKLAELECRAEDSVIVDPSA